MKKICCSAFLAILLLSGCGSNSNSKTNHKSTGDTTTQSSETVEVSTPNTEVVNQKPIVNAGTDKTVTVNETITITGTATDSDGTIVSYEWTKGSDVLGTEASLSYTPTVVGTDKLTLTVTDDDGATASDSVNIVVVEESNDNIFDDIKK